MGQGLEGLKVIELGGGVAAPQAGKLMADLGAEVVKIEPPGGEPGRFRGPFPAAQGEAGAGPEGNGTGAPGGNGGGDPETSGLYLFLNSNKRSVVLELESAAGQASLEALLGRADMLIHDFPPARMEALGLNFDRFAALNPALVMLSITPFGLSGPYRDYAAEDLQLIHGSGWGWSCPGPGAPAELAPIKPFGSHALIQAGLHGATAALAAHWRAGRTGAGEHVDCSALEVTINLLGRHFVNYTYAHILDDRTGPRAIAPNGFFQCRDGGVYLVVIEEDQWQRLLELMGDPAWAKSQKFKDRFTRGEHAGEVHGRIGEWLADWKVEDFYHATQQRRVCGAIVYSHEGLERDAHLRARGFFQTTHHPVAGEIVLPGAPYVLQQDWWALRSPAPLLGEANGELDRLFTGNGAPARQTGAGAPGAQAGATAGAKGPAQAGATPMTEESPRPAGQEESTRQAGPQGVRGQLLPLEGVRVLDFTWYWAGPHGTLMLAHLGAEVIKVESPARPDLMRRLNNSPHDMEPGLNRTGSFNQGAQGKLSLALNLAHPEGKALALRLAAECDVAASNFSTGVMERLGLGAAALHEANPELVIAALSGFGQSGPCKDYMGYGQAIVPLAGISAETGYVGGGAEEVAIAYGDPNGGIYEAFAIVAALAARARHGGGQYIDVSLWESMICTGFEGWMNHALGNPPHAPMGDRDPRWAPHNCYRCTGEDAWVAIAAVDEIVSAWCAPQPPWQVTQALQAAGVPAFPSLNTRQVDEDPHLNAREFFGRAPHAEVGVRSHAGIPWRLARGRNGVRHAAPLMGEHTEQVLQSVLGLSPGEIEALKKDGAVG